MGIFTTTERNSRKEQVFGTVIGCLRIYSRLCSVWTFKSFSTIFIIKSDDVILFKIFPELDLDDFKRDNSRVF